MIDWIQIFSNASQELISPTTAAYALAALGLAIHFGYTGLLNMGQAGFMLLGAYGFGLIMQRNVNVLPACAAIV